MKYSMRIVIISDMHANCVALDAVLDDLKRDSIDQMVCLGDAIQSGPQPAEVVVRLRTLACPVVMGNADDWLLTGHDSGAETIVPEQARKMDAVRMWSLAQLSDEDKTFIHGFKPTVEIALPDTRMLLCFHGSPRSFDDVILPTTPEEDLAKYFSGFLPRLMCGGHTHMQQIRRIGQTNAFFFNPGSVGIACSHQQPKDHFRADPWAEYAVLTVDTQRTALELRRVSFDVQHLIDIYRASGRPYADDAILQYAA